MLNDKNTLYLSGCNLNTESDLKYEEVAEQILRHRNLEILQLHGIPISSIGGELFSRTLSTKSELRECSLINVSAEVSKKEISEVLYALERGLSCSGCHLTTLDLSGNAFESENSSEFGDFFESKTFFWLESLTLNNNSLGSMGEVLGKSLCTLLSSSRRNGTPMKMKKFSCEGNRLEVDSTIALTDFFIMAGTLEEIRLSNNAIRQPAFGALVEAFRCNQHLRVIDLSGNDCKTEGAIEIGDVLPELHNLEVINIGDCRCEDPGVTAIINGLYGKQRLQKVVLRRNNITAGLIEEIGQYFSYEELQHVKVDLSCNMLGEEFDFIEEAFEFNKNLDFGRREEDELVNSEELFEETKEEDVEEENKQSSSNVSHAERHENSKNDANLLCEIEQSDIQCERIVLFQTARMIAIGGKMLIHCEETSNDGEAKKKAIETLNRSLKKVDLESYPELTKDFFEELRKMWAEQEILTPFSYFLPILSKAMNDENGSLLKLFENWKD